MKFLVAMCMVSFATVSLAADRAIYDLQYLPKASSTFGKSELSLVQGTSEDDTDVEGEYEGWLIEQTVGHSFTDNFLVTLNADFLHLDSKFELGALESTESDKGLSDPKLGARYRALEESVILDLTADAIIKTGDAETDGHLSNNKQGGNSLRLGVEAGQKMESLQYVGTLQLNRVFEVTNDIDGDKIKDDAHNEILMGAAVLFKVAEPSFIKASLAAEFAEEYDDNDDVTTASRTAYFAGVEYRHVFSKDLMLTLGVDRTDFHTAGLDNYALYSVTAGALYQF